MTRLTRPKVTYYAQNFADGTFEEIKLESDESFDDLHEALLKCKTELFQDSFPLSLLLQGLLGGWSLLDLIMSYLWTDDAFLEVSAYLQEKNEVIFPLLFASLLLTGAMRAFIPNSIPKSTSLLLFIAFVLNIFERPVIEMEGKFSKKSPRDILIGLANRGLVNP